MPDGEEIPPGRATLESKALRVAVMERDSVAGNDYDQARYCSALEGRFLSADRVGGYPVNPQSWNRYAYAGNNPDGMLWSIGQSHMWSRPLQSS